RGNEWEARRRPSPRPNYVLCRAAGAPCVPAPIEQGSGLKGTYPVRRRTFMASEWFYTRDGKSKAGPVSSAQLQALAKSEQLLPTDMVWKKDLVKWIPASTIKGLFPSRPCVSAPHPSAQAITPQPVSSPIPFSRFIVIVGGSAAILACMM